MGGGRVGLNTGSDERQVTACANYTPTARPSRVVPKFRAAALGPFGGRGSTAPGGGGRSSGGAGRYCRDGRLGRSAARRLGGHHVRGRRLGLGACGSRGNVKQGEKCDATVEGGVLAVIAQARVRLRIPACRDVRQAPRAQTGTRYG